MLKKITKLAALILMVTLIVTMITGCSGKNSSNAVGGDLAKKVVLTIDDTEVTMDTMMYYIMQQEAEYSYDDVYSMATYGTSYWDLELDDDGTTVREEVKKYVLEMAQLYEVFYLEAGKTGYELTEENIEEAKANASSIWLSMSDNQKKVTGLTEETLIEIFKRISLATKYYDDIESELAVDEEEITAGVKKEDYKEYIIEMMCLDKMEEINDEGTMDYVPEKKLKAAKKRMEKYRKKIKKETSLRDVLSKKEKRIYVQDMTFIEGDKRLNSTLEEAAKKLDNDGHTEIIDTTDGYVIIRMVDNASTESYDRAVQTAIENAKEEALEQKYQDVKKSYKIEIKEDIWEPIEIGNLTIDEEAESENTIDSTKTELEE